MGPLKQPFQLCDRHAFDAGNSLGRSNQFAQVYPFSESQTIGMEEPEPSIRQHPVTEQIQHRRLDMTPQIAGQHADQELEIERYALRDVNHQVMPNASITIESPLNLFKQCSIGFFPTHRIHRDRKSTRLNSSHHSISYAVFCL